MRPAQCANKYCKLRAKACPRSQTKAPQEGEVISAQAKAIITSPCDMCVGLIAIVTQTDDC